MAASERCPGSAGEFGLRDPLPARDGQWPPDDGVRPTGLEVGGPTALIVTDRP